MRKGLIILIVVSVLLIGVDIVRHVWIGTGKNSSAAFATLLQPPARTSANPKSNSYLLLLGFASDPAVDPAQTGYEIWLEVESIPGQRFFDYGKEQRTQLQVEILPEAALQTSADPLQTLTAQQAVLLDRYRQWLSLPVFEDWGYGHPGSPRFQEIYVAHRLYVGQGLSQSLAQAVDRLQRDLTVWRTVLAKATTLPVKMAAVGMVEDDVMLISSLLRRPDFSNDFLQILESLVRPLTKSERSLHWPILNEFTLEVARYEKAWNGSEDLKQKESDSNKRWVAALIGLTLEDFEKVEFPVPANWFAKAPAQKQKTLGLYAAYSEALTKASEIPNSPLPKLQDIARASHRSYLDYFINPIDNIFASTDNESGWKVFADRLLETEARLRLVSLQARLHRPSRGQSIPIRVIQAGTAFYDPFSGIPMLWNPATGQLYSVGKDGKDNGGDFTTDIAVSVSMTEVAPAQPAPETKRKPKR
jgi:hypothetical protein